MEELFRYYLENIIILRIGTCLRYLWLRFVRHRKISYRTLYEGSKSKKTSELSNFENEMSNRHQAQLLPALHCQSGLLYHRLS